MQPSVTLRGAFADAHPSILTGEALDFVGSLERELREGRRAALAARAQRQAAFDRGQLPGLLPETASVRSGGWSVAPPPRDLEDRRVEITGPVDRKMMINALNSGARVFMADFEDALSPTWENVVQGQANLHDAARGTLAFTSPEGKSYALGDEVATLVVRPRGWHLPEKHVLVDGAPASASLVDFGLYAFHNAKALRAKGSGAYLYLPKLESHREARLWAQAFAHAERALGLPKGTTKATILVETLPAAFEMDEILHELRDHAVGLNAGRWDYLFSLVKTFRAHPDRVLPDRAQLTMGVPFMRAYAERLVATCHRRGAHAIGGMAAFIPNRRDPGVTERALAKVKEDKEREAAQGFDGTWVAHPDLVPVARAAFDTALGSKPHQKHLHRAGPAASADALLDLRVEGGRVTLEGVRGNARAALRYTEAWLRGTGAVALDNLMEDAATAEIARAQLWQWSRHGAALDGEGKVTPDLVRRAADDALAQAREELGEAYGKGRFKEARALLEATALTDPFVEFLTLPAYDHLER